MFTQVFISSPGGSNQLGSKLCRVSLNKKEKTLHSSGLCRVSLNKKEKTLHRSGLQVVCYEFMVYHVICIICSEF